MRQAIHIANWVSNTIFSLPCIYSVHKEADNTLCYLLYDWDSNGQYIKARPGQWLVEDNNGQWHVMSDEEYHNIKKQNDYGNEDRMD